MHEIQRLRTLLRLVDIQSSNRRVTSNMRAKYRNGLRTIVAAGLVVASILGIRDLCAQQRATPAPQRLADTGLFAAGSTRDIAPGVLAFSPQYPLWSDGATKRRWIAL